MKKIALIGCTAALVLTLTACTSSDYKAAGELFDQGDYAAAQEAYTALADYKDSSTKVQECLYLQAKACMESEDWAGALTLLGKISDYEDAADLTLQCQYEQAVDAYEAEDYDTALEIFEDLGDYSDSSSQVQKCKYDKAASLLEAGDYASASVLFEELGDYSDSSYMWKESEYLRAAALHDSGDYEGAIAVYRTLGDYKQSEDLMKGCDYNRAAEMIENGQAEEAYQILLDLGSYTGAEELAYKARLQFDPYGALADWIAEHKDAGSADNVFTWTDPLLINLTWKEKDSSGELQTLSQYCKVKLYEENGDITVAIENISSGPWFNNTDNLSLIINGTEAGTYAQSRNGSIAFLTTTNYNYSEHAKIDTATFNTGSYITLTDTEFDYTNDDGSSITDEEISDQLSDIISCIIEEFQRFLSNYDLGTVADYGFHAFVYDESRESGLRSHTMEYDPYAAGVAVTSETDS